MNKKVNTALFILGATLFNLALMFVLLLLLLVLIAVVFKDTLNPTLLSILTLVLFLGSLAGTFLIYRMLLNWISKRVDLEKYLIPIFKRKR